MKMWWKSIQRLTTDDFINSLEVEWYLNKILMLMLWLTLWKKSENVSILFMMDTIHTMPTCTVPAVELTTQHGHQHCWHQLLKGLWTQSTMIVFNHYLMFLTVYGLIFPKQISCCCEASPQLSETENKAGNVSWKAAYHCKDAMFVLNHRHHTPTSRNSMPNWHLLSESPVSRSLEGLLCLHGSLEL